MIPILKKMKVKQIFVEKIKSLACVKVEETPKNKKNRNSKEGNLDLLTPEEEQHVSHSQNERIIDL